MSAPPQPFQFRKKILLTFTAGLSLYLLFLLASTWIFYLAQEQVMIRTPLYAIPERMTVVQYEETAQMEALLLNLAGSERMLQLWRKRDREELLRQAQPVFEILRQKLQITHLYFTDNDRSVFLRVHHPTRFGDVVDRFTTEEAQRTGKVASGFELGPLGTLTLRVVMPVRQEGKVVGFLEMGKELSSLLDKVSRGMNIQIFPFLDKKKLDPIRWQEGMHMLWQGGTWDRFPQIIYTGTAKELPEGMEAYLASGKWRNEKVETTLWAGIGQSDEESHFFAVPMTDVRHSVVGWLVGSQGHEGLRDILFTYVSGLLLSSMGIGGVLLFLFHRHLRRVEERMQAAHQKVAEVEESLALAQEVARVGNWDWRVGKEVFFSNEARRILGFSSDAPPPKGARAILGPVHPQERRRMVHWLRAVLKGESAGDAEYRILGKDGVIRIVQNSIRLFRENEKVVRVEGILHDVTEMRCIQESLHIATTTFEQAIQEQSQRFEQMIQEKRTLESLSLSDALTGLGNRRFFEISLIKGIEYSRRKEQKLALLMLDLDGFKPINDTLGHDAGDLMLQTVAERLREQVRLSDQIYRIGGDEFAVLIPDPRDDTQVLAVAERISFSLAQPFHIKGESCTIGCSVGSSLFPRHGETPHALMSRADIALYWIKRHGKGKGCIFSDEMEQKSRPPSP